MTCIMPQQKLGDVVSKFALFMWWNNGVHKEIHADSDSVL